MELTAQVIWAITLYKIICLTVGAMICILGFRLFFGGTQNTGDRMDVSFGKLKLILNTTAPGTFFAVLGAGVVVATIVQGLDFKLNANGNDIANSSTVGTLVEPKLPPLP